MNSCEKGKNYLLLIAALVVVFIFFGFIFRYQIITTATNAIVLNRLTGQKQIIKLDGEVVIVEEFGSKDGPKLTLIDVDSLRMKMECKIKWRNGRLYYIAELNLPESTYEKSSKYPHNAKINIDLLDKDGYLISTIPIELKACTQYPLEGATRKLQINDSVSFKRSEFEAISTWDITWIGINE
ncbi:MAG: hypothetical protein ABFD07_09450 [Methanobacterium sp.]